jgi:GTP-binding protein
MDDIAAQLREAGAGDIYPISGATGNGIPALLDQVVPLLDAHMRDDSEDSEDGGGPETPWSPL